MAREGRTTVAAGAGSALPHLDFCGDLEMGAHFQDLSDHRILYSNAQWHLPSLRHALALGDVEWIDELSPVGHRPHRLCGPRSAAGRLSHGAVVNSLVIPNLLDEGDLGLSPKGLLHLFGRAPPLRVRPAPFLPRVPVVRKGYVQIGRALGDSSARVPHGRTAPFARWRATCGGARRVAGRPSCVSPPG